MYFISIPIVVGIILGMYVVSDLVVDPVNDQVLLTSKYLTNNGSPKNGFDDATVSMVEFGDYQCTFCHKFHQNTLNAIKMQYIDTGKVSFVYRDFPLNGRDSILAAEASYCADDQGKYWEYHNMLFSNWAGENTGWITESLLLDIANFMDLNITEFDYCLNQHTHYQKVIDNENYAKQVGINATPSFLIFNDKQLIKIIGAQPLEKFQNAINQLG